MKINIHLTQVLTITTLQKQKEIPNLFTGVTTDSSNAAKHTIFDQYDARHYIILNLDGNMTDLIAHGDVDSVMIFSGLTNKTITEFDLSADNLDANYYRTLNIGFGTGTSEEIQNRCYHRKNCYRGAADFNGDGFDDLILYDIKSGRIQVALNNYNNFQDDNSLDIINNSKDWLRINGVSSSNLDNHFTINLADLTGWKIRFY